MSVNPDTEFTIPCCFLSIDITNYSQSLFNKEFPNSLLLGENYYTSILGDRYGHGSGVLKIHGGRFFHFYIFATYLLPSLFIFIFLHFSIFTFFQPPSFRARSWGPLCGSCRQVAEHHKLSPERKLICELCHNSPYRMFTLTKFFHPKFLHQTTFRKKHPGFWRMALKYI